MSLWCECLDCGGSGDAFICENGLMRAQMMAARSQNSLLTMLAAPTVWPAIALMLGMMIAAFPTAHSPQVDPPHKSGEAARISDRF